MLLLIAIAFIATAATTKLSSLTKNSTNTTELSDKTKACILACNICVSSCLKVQAMYTKNEKMKMMECNKLCKECVIACTKSVKAMQLNDPKYKEKCLESAKICNKCATECDKFNSAECKNCAIDCRSAAKHCMEM